MIELDLHSAVDQIVRATRRRAPSGAAPFFFIVGAGISYPPIPLAAGIEQLCRKEILDQGLTPPPVGGSALDRYQTCFETAFSQAEERQIFLHQHLHSTRISAANFRLAHLLSEGDLTKLVFTPNFDEMLTRALRLFGHETIVCDHPKTTQRIDPRRPDLQVVHVHGTHWFYDCCNLRGEIEGQARSDLTDSISMGQLLDRVLAERSPIVVGYSGWKGDVIMTALRRRLQQPTLRFNLYWFCFRRSEADALPTWLTNHSSVRLVLPPKASVEAEPKSTGGSSRDAVENLGRDRENDGSSKEPVLPSRDVFEAFIQKLDLRAPHLTDEPLEFFLKHLERNLDPEDASGRLFLIREVFDRVRVGMELEKSKRLGGSAAQQRTAEALHRVSDAIRRSAYPAAIQVARDVDLSLLDAEQRKELDEALKAAYLALADSEPELGLQACEVWGRLAEFALASGEPKESTWLASVAGALHGKGYCLSALGRWEAAIESYSELVRRFGESRGPLLEERVAKALFNQGFVFRSIEKFEASVNAYSDVVRRFSESKSLILQVQVAKSLINLGIVFSMTENLQAAIDSYSEVIRRFGVSKETALREQVAKALVNRGMTFSAIGKPDDGARDYSQAIDLVGDSQGHVFEEVVAKAIFNRGVAFDIVGNPEAAIETYSQMIQRFDESPEPVLRDLVSRARINREAALNALGSRAQIPTTSEAAISSSEGAEPADRG